jgi:hypothetical protein
MMLINGVSELKAHSDEAQPDIGINYLHLNLQYLSGDREKKMFFVIFVIEKTFVAYSLMMSSFPVVCHKPVLFQHITSKTVNYDMSLVCVSREAH